MQIIFSPCPIVYIWLKVHNKFLAKISYFDYVMPKKMFSFVSI